LSDDARRLIAKFSSTADSYPVVKGEYLAMELARRAGLDVAAVELTHTLGKDVLLIGRFDRPAAGGWRPPGDGLGADHPQPGRGGREVCELR
jgi:serine/threonine-protein kinase HipA